MKRFIYSVLGLLMISSCSKSEENEENNLSSKIIVEGFVFANEPVSIKLSSVDGSGSSSTHPAPHAQVALKQGNSIFTMIENDTVPGLYEQENPTVLLVDTGVTKLEINHKGHNHIAQATFPSKLTGLQISEDEIIINQENPSAEAATISWNEVQNSFGYCMFVRRSYLSEAPVLNLVASLTAENPFTRIINNTSVTLQSKDFQYLGSYEIYVTAVGPEYEVMYTGYGNSSLTAAPSNIGNGLGVFTLFNGQAVTVNVQ